MGENSRIEWCDHTFNPWLGCAKVSPACDNCYAEALMRRTGHPELWEGERRRTSPENWRLPPRWNKKAETAEIRPKVFCASMADIFDNKIPRRWRDDLWHLIAQTPHLDWLLLSKRPQNIAAMLPGASIGAPEWGEGWPNVWLGTTVENQEEADRRIPRLLAVPAARHFLSCEPLLGPVDLEAVKAPSYVDEDDADGWTFDCLNTGDYYRLNGKEGGEGPYRSASIDWVITGGETGPNARPSHPKWFQSLRDQCAAPDVPFFFKQWGEWTPGLNVERQTGRVRTAHWINDQWAFSNEDLARTDGHIDDEPDLYRVGKKKAGAFLDGHEHREFPK